MYANFGLIPYDYGAAMFLLGLLGSAAGQLATSWAVRALGRRSVIVFLMASLVGGAFLVSANCGICGWRRGLNYSPPSVCHHRLR